MTIHLPIAPAINDDPGLFPDRVKMDETLRAFFSERSLPHLGGASGRGWSFYGSFARCAYLHFQTYRSMYEGSGDISQRWMSIDEDVFESDQRELGSLVHAALALRYSSGFARTPLSPEPVLWPDPDTLIDYATTNHPELAMDARRIYRAYTAFCDGQGDYDDILAVEKYMEYTDEDDGFTVTTKPDLIVRKVTAGAADGVVIVDHKTATRFDYVTKNEWRNSGQLLTQALVYRGMGEPYGPLRFMEINLIGKQKEPQFERIPLPPPTDGKLRDHARLLRFLNANRQHAEISNYWPQTGRDVGCSGRGLCSLFDHCAAML